MDVDTQKETNRLARLNNFLGVRHNRRSRKKVERKEKKVKVEVEVEKKEGERAHSVFNNPAAIAEYNKLSDDEKAYYKTVGEQMYNTPVGMDPLTHSINESLQIITTSLKTGMMPSLLSQDEVNLLEDQLGERWYEKFDITPEDL